MLSVMSSSLPESVEFPMRLGVIDLGSNSAHLLIVQIWEDCTFNQIYWDRAMVRLGSPVFEKGEIDSQTRSNTLAVIGKFLQSCRHHQVDVIRAVGTSALREATNRIEFIESIKSEFQIEVDVISGREEARLTALAASESLGLTQGKVFVMDVGGGSTEAALLVDNVCQEVWSFRLGPVRLLKKVALEDPPGKQGLESLRRVSQKSLSSLFRANIGKPDWALATSGTALCLGELCGTKRRAVTSLETNVIVMPALKNLIERLAEMDLAKRRTWMDRFGDRADTVLSGGMIFLTVMEELGLDTFVTGGKALRDGIIRDFLQREILTTAKDRSARLVQSARTGTLPADPRAVREQNILKYARTYHYDAEHCRKTLDLASWLFDGLRQVTWLGDEDRFYLQSAALLHDIGYYINPTNHHQHSQYLVLHSDLEGFHQMELRLIANLVRYHRDEEPSLDHPEYATLPEGLQKKVDLLSGMLMIADGLDFTHMGLVESLSVEVNEEKVHIHVVSAREVDLDIHEARAKCVLLERCLGRKVEITSEAKAGTPVLDIVE